MKVIIAGCRDWRDTPLTPKQAYCAVVRAVYNSGWYQTLAGPGFDFEITEVVSGGARGIDTAAIDWAIVNWVPWKEFKAKWDAGGFYDPSAGHKRNEQMAQYADALIAVWDGKSPGTRDMISRARAHNLKIHIERITPALLEIEPWPTNSKS